MPWQYTSATFHGQSAANPQAGDRVSISLQNADDPDDVQTRSLTWTFDGSQSKAQFVTMVRTEIVAHLAHLNSQPAQADATPTFDPS